MFRLRTRNTHPRRPFVGRTLKWPSDIQRWCPDDLWLNCRLQELHWPLGSMSSFLYGWRETAPDSNRIIIWNVCNKLSAAGSMPALLKLRIFAPATIDQTSVIIYIFYISSTLIYRNNLHNCFSTPAVYHMLFVWRSLLPPDNKTTNGIISKFCYK